MHRHVNILQYVKTPLGRWQWQPISKNIRTENYIWAKAKSNGSRRGLESIAPPGLAEMVYSNCEIGLTTKFGGGTEFLSARDDLGSREEGFEIHYTISDLAKQWHLGRKTVRLLLKDEPGVLKIRMGARKSSTRYSVP